MMRKYIQLLPVPATEAFDAAKYIHVTFLASRTHCCVTPFCADMDNDHDVDCLVGNENGRVYYYENTGSASNAGYFPFSTASFVSSSTDLFGVRQTSQNDLYSAPFCADFDNDGDMDCIVGVEKSSSQRSNVHYFERTGNNFSWVTDNFFDVPEFAGSDISTYSKPYCLDFDLDSDLDCLLGDASGNVHYLRNDGTPESYAWTYITDNAFEHINSRNDTAFGGYAAPVCVKKRWYTPSDIMQ